MTGGSDAVVADAPAMPFRSILVPLDDSPVAARVFETAVALARLLRAKVHLLRVVTVDPVFPPAAHVVPDGLEGRLLLDALAELDGYVVAARDVELGPTKVVIGDPWRRILDVAREVDAELIVLGSHRYHGVDRILGTVVSKVVNHADRAVLVVRPPVNPG